MALQGKSAKDAYQEWLKENTLAQTPEDTGDTEADTGEAAVNQQLIVNPVSSSSSRRAANSQYSTNIAGIMDQLAQKGNYQSKYSDTLGTLYSRVMDAGPYESQYADKVRGLYDEISGRGAYESQYADKARGLYDEISGRGAYESQYADQIRGLYDEISGRGPYESQYAGQIQGLYDQLSGRGAYESPYEAQIKTLYNSLMARPQFEYDANKDPLYQQYRDQYIRGGQQAMRDTMGASAALTGGYGNSWGNTAGYQAYQSYLQALNDKIPELSQAAYSRYQQEGEDIKDRLSAAMTMDAQDYSRYQDETDRLRQAMSDAMSMDAQDYSRYQDEEDRLRQRLSNALAMDEQEYGRYQDETDRLRQAMSDAMSMDAQDYSRYQDEEDRLRQRLSTALAMDEQDYGRYQDEMDALRQKYSAAYNAEAADWQRYMQEIEALQNAAKLNAALRESDYEMGLLSGGTAGNYDLETLIAALQAAGIGGGGTSDTMDSLLDAVSTETLNAGGFNNKEYLASKLGIASGDLQKNTSPLTTFGSTMAANQYYSDMYDKMDAEASNKTGGSGNTKSGGGSDSPLDLAKKAIEAAQSIISGNSSEQSEWQKKKNIVYQDD